MTDGLQAVLKLYFVHYLFVCSGTKRATSLATTCVNIFLTITEGCAISAGLLADKVIGEQRVLILEPWTSYTNNVPQILGIRLF